MIGEDSPEKQYFDALSFGRQKSRSLWNAYYLRQKRRRLMLRALRKRRELKSVTNNTGGITSTSILCAMVMRNEMTRLPWFLEHHRKLGIDHFLIVDNGSTDGSAEYLRAQHDVSLWSTSARYRSARFGLDWLNWLLMRYAHGNWCLVLDADELFIYPYHETRPLSALTEWLERQGCDAMPAMMLDLYPKEALGRQDYMAGDDPLKLLVWFDHGNYTVSYQERLRNLWIQGGVRRRVFFPDRPRFAPTLNKIPLVKWNWRTVWYNSTHSMLPPKRNALYAEAGGEYPSGALLHLKFLPEIVPKSAEEKGRGQHFGRPEQFDAYYDMVTAGPVLHCQTSKKYTGWRQLEALGIISRGGWI